MASKRIQTSVSGRVLEYLEDMGKSQRAAPASWAGRGLARILDEHISEAGGRFDRWLCERFEAGDFVD